MPPLTLDFDASVEPRTCDAIRRRRFARAAPLTLKRHTPSHHYAVPRDTRAIRRQCDSAAPRERVLRDDVTLLRQEMFMPRCRYGHLLCRVHRLSLNNILPQRAVMITPRIFYLSGERYAFICWRY